MLLRQMLYRCEIRFLPIIAGFWMNLRKTPNYEDLIRILCERMLDPVYMRKMLEGSEGPDLSAGTRELIRRGGVIPSDEFEKQFGELRIAGIERINREKYWANPVSVTEKLWYRGFIFPESRFVNGELKDCFLIPEDLREVINPLLGEQPGPAVTPDPVPVVRPAIPSETAFVLPTDTTVCDIVCTAAALKRSGRPFQIPGLDFSAEYERFIQMLLAESGFFPEGKAPDPEKIRKHLIQNRTAASLELIRAWRRSETYDELRENTRDLTVREDPIFPRPEPRVFILKMLSLLSPDTWWSLNSFISAVKRLNISFLRGSFAENGRGQIYDTEGNDLSGIGAWYQLEGAYIRFLIFGPLSWLGIIQPAFSDKEKREPSAFRISREAAFYLKESAEKDIPEEILTKPNLEQGVPNIGADGAVSCSCSVPRYFRYMAARACEIEQFKNGIFIFRITPNSLNEAEREGITREAFLALLKRFTGKTVPPSLERMLTAEKKNALPATIYSAVILTVPSGEILSELMETPRLEKWILQQINPNSLIIDPKGIEMIRRFLMEKELFVDVQIKVPAVKSGNS